MLRKQVMIVELPKTIEGNEEGEEMASRLEFVQFIVDQLADAGAITYRKMFGEYGIYCDGKFFAMVCDDQLFMKITDKGKQLAPELEEAPPYPGAKPCFLIDDVDDKEFLVPLAVETCHALPAPKPKAPRKKKAREQAT